MLHCQSRTRRTPQTATVTATMGAGTTGQWAARSDENLMVEYVQQGTREAFEELVHRYERELYGYLRRFLHSAELAEDAFQAVFLQLHLNCRQFDPGRKFRPWLYRIATTRAIDLMRQNRRHKMISLNAELSSGGNRGLDLVNPRETNPSEQLEAAETGQEIRSAVESFPTRLKDVLVLVMFQGLRYQEAADTLGIPLGSVKSRLHEATSRLRRAMTVPPDAGSRKGSAARLAGLQSAKP
jgi:RNA polymerase sigma-70 factor, ECF subfamily